ncbi:ATP-dependent DNA ligase [Thermocrinis sp.]|uniref:ATP-dependent DNA ligase n=1 Tax=Thermocrinis sp. TaxID=2024383 RepID=UPI002FDE797E
MKFSELAQFFEKLEKTTSRLEMSQLLYELFSKADKEEIDKVVYLTMGELVPSFRGLEFGMSEKLAMEALSKASGTKLSVIQKLYKELGDVGKVALEVIKREGKGLSVSKVYEELFSIARARGTLDKVMLLINLLKALSGVEAKFVVRIIVGNLRLGVGEATIIEALALLLGNRDYKQVVERAYNLCSDLGLVAETLAQKGLEGLEEFKIQPGYPIRMALAERVADAEELIRRLGRCAIEVKYDGFRLQVHKKNNEVYIYSRNLEPMTEMFPEIKQAVAKIDAEELIVEGEALAVNEETGEFYPFQITMQRKRKYQIYEYSKEYPLKLFCFDLLYLDGEDYTIKPFIDRRKRLEGLITLKNTLELSELRIVQSAKEVEEFFEDAILRGLEGIMGKRLDAPYTAGSRNFNWVKLKRGYKGQLMDTIDVVIVGYFYGKGARAKLGIGTLLTAVYDPSSDTFKTISKVGSGFSEEEWIRLKEILDEIKLDHRHARVDSLITPDVWVEPKYVITVSADEITRSPLHTAGKTGDEPGYALRFPRAVGFVRSDKRPEDANTVEEILRMYQLQRKIKVE